MKKRERTTWTAGRNASAPPATPGYGTEDQDHPAHKADPSHEEYAEGDPSAWAEDVREPPYPEGNPPATPGYDAEDQDHPAHQSPPRVPKEADLKVLVAAKATKCWKLANLMLEAREGVTAEMVEDQAYDLMDWSDSQIVAAAERLGKTADFLAEDKDEDEDGKEAAIDDVLAEDPKVAALIEENRKLKAQLDVAAKKGDEEEEGEEEVEEASKKAGDEEEEGEEASKKADEEEVEEEEEVDEASKKASPMRALFASMDTDNDGFLAAEDWTAKKALFEAIDADNDGFITSDEFMDYMEPEAVMDVETDDGLDPEEVALLAEMEAQACGEEPMAEGIDPGVEEEVVMDEPIMAESQDDAADEDKDKEAAAEVVADERVDEAGIFAMTDDPMGVGTTAEDDAILKEIFGGKAAAEEEVEEEAEVEEASKKAEEVEEEAEEEVEEASKKANKTAAQRPQPRKPATGVQTVGAVTRTASGPSEVDDLSNLWAKAPDVDPVFNPQG